MSEAQLLLSPKYKAFLKHDAPVEFLEGTTYAGKDVYKRQSVTIPDSVKFIDDCAFVNCTSLKEISISKNTKLGKNVFLRCPKDLKITWR